MRSFAYLLVLASLYNSISALISPSSTSPFTQTTPSNETSLEDLFDLELLRKNVVPDKVARQVITVTVGPSTTTIAGGACGNSWHACSALGAPGLCCPANAVCSADYNGRAACCPSGSVCTGVAGSSGIQNGGVVATTTVQGASTNTAVVGVIPTTANAGQVTATAGSGFVVAAGTTVALLGSAARPTALVSSLVLVMVLFIWRG